PGGPSPVFGRAAGRLGERVGAAPPSLRPGDSRRPSLERVRRSVSLTGSPPSATLRPRSRPAGFLDRLRLRRRSEDEGPFPMVKSRSEEHTSELQSRENLVCRLLLEKKNKHK